MLRGDRVHLRTVQRGDIEMMNRLASEIANRGAYYPLDLWTETSLRADFDKDGIWGKDFGMMLIFDTAELRLIGQIVFFQTVNYYQGFEIGYLIYDPKDRGKGYATAALRQFSKFLFDNKNILRLTVQVEPGNHGSRRVAEKCGYKFEGIARSAFISYGKPTDIEVWSLTHTDVYGPS